MGSYHVRAKRQEILRKRTCGGPVGHDERERSRHHKGKNGLGDKGTTGLIPNTWCWGGDEGGTKATKEERNRDERRVAKRKINLWKRG